MELSVSGLRIVVTEEVYQPAEDSFMLADAASHLNGSILEIGCGSGLASLSAAKSNPKNTVIGVDINQHAVKCARTNAKLNHLANVKFIESNLFANVPKKKFDAIMFNPPYLPTSEDELVKGPLNHAFDGGKNGRTVLERFLANFDNFLKPGGTLLLIQSSLNDKEKTITKLESFGYTVQIAKEEKFFFERLFLLKAVKPIIPTRH